MGFRDPRVLSETLDNNATNTPAAPPSAETVAFGSNQGAANEWTGSGPNTNAYNQLFPPPTVEVDQYPSSPLVEYPGGAPDTNVTKGPNERDTAWDRSKGLV